tara:strand:+ start:629 stop:895 length:267 start_codon:yes stop_codon:yes gene_type:complete
MRKILSTLVIILLFFLAEKSFAESKLKPECIYESTAQVVDGKLINHKEKISCVEVKKPNILISVITGENSGEFMQFFFGTIFFIMEHM